MGTTEPAPSPLRFLHIGDLHITDAGLANHRDFQRIVDETNAHLADRIDFAFLPGDIADDGMEAQFALVKAELARLKTPWHAITGDHDFKPRSLDAFYRVLGARKLPYACDVAGLRCLFLDLVAAGSGGPDFRLGEAQTAWLREELGALSASGRKAVIFMHAYPADLRDGAAEIAALIDRSPVVLVDMGHTHYNELSHDGRTIYAATRSTGQIEEGDVGFSLIAVDGETVSWRFKPLDSDWPFIMITAPADRRLAFSERAATGHRVRAVAFGDSPKAQAVCRLNEGPWQTMVRRERGLFESEAELPPLTAPRAIEVRLTDADGRSATDRIEQSPTAAARSSSGSDAGAIGEWRDRHIYGTQLGPNRNGRKW